MMKQILLLLALSMSLLNVSAAEFVEDKDYKLLSMPGEVKGDKVEVLEFFWYGCPHCFHFEPHIQKWEKTKPDHVDFDKVPAVFHKTWKMHARTFYALRQMGIEEEISPRIFNILHVLRRPLNDLKQMSGGLQRMGVDKDKFLEAYNSFTVETEMRKAVKLMEEFQITGVPSVIVNRKYLLTGTISGTYEKLIETLDYLIKKEKSSGKK